jgi:hypothetical protein
MPLEATPSLPAMRTARLSPAEATSRVVDLLDDPGFAPEAPEEVSTHD